MFCGRLLTCLFTMLLYFPKILVFYFCFSIIRYSSQYSMKCFIHCAFFVFQAVTSSALKKGGLYALHVGSCFKYKKSIIDVKVDTDSNVSRSLLFFSREHQSFLIIEYFHFCNLSDLFNYYFHGTSPINKGNYYSNSAWL